MAVRVAVVGCGAISRRAHLPALKAAGADVTVFASGRASSATEARDEWGSGTVVADWQAAVARDDVDAVVVATPNVLHADIAVAAAAAGKHVLVEKPMALTIAEADAMIAAAADAGVVLMPAHNLRLAPPLVAARQAIAAGRIGTPTAFMVALVHGGPLLWSPGSDWFVDGARAGGGALLDLGVHLADAARFLLGDDAVSVTAALGPTIGTGVEESGVAHVVMRSGAFGSIEASWAADNPNHAVTVIGDDGVIALGGGRAVTLRSAGGTVTELPMTAPDTIAAAFLRAVEGGEPTPSAADGRASLALVLAAYRAAAERRAVALEEFA